MVLGNKTGRREKTALMEKINIPSFRVTMRTD